MRRSLPFFKTVLRSITSYNERERPGAPGNKEAERGLDTASPPRFLPPALGKRRIPSLAFAIMSRRKFADPPDLGRLAHRDDRGDVRVH